MPSTKMIRELLTQLDAPFTGEILFDHLPDIVFFIKNARAQYVAVNRTLVERCGRREKSELIGRTPSQVFQSPLGERFEAQDHRVLRTGRPLLGMLELHLYPSRRPGWCLTNKLPLFRSNGTVGGLVGVSQDLRLPDASAEEYQHVAAALDYAMENLADAPTVADLADVAAMSRFQFDGRMQRVFGLTAGQWLLKLRLEHAQLQLLNSDHSIASIAATSGYSDQSAFARQFRQATGLSPREYRRTRAGRRSAAVVDEPRRDATIGHARKQKHSAAKRTRRSSESRP